MLIELFSVDLANPNLSPEQVAHAAIWQEPPPQEYKLRNSSNPPRAEDIIQHVVPDCSLCAAVAVCIDHDRRFGSKLVRSALNPQYTIEPPTPSSPKSHSLRVLFNGAYRKASY
jgi:calpain-7